MMQDWRVVLDLAVLLVSSPTWFLDALLGFRGVVQTWRQAGYPPQPQCWPDLCVSVCRLRQPNVAMSVGAAPMPRPALVPRGPQAPMAPPMVPREPVMGHPMGPAAVPLYTSQVRVTPPMVMAPQPWQPAGGSVTLAPMAPNMAAAMAPVTMLPSAPTSMPPLTAREVPLSARERIEPLRS